jgi:hypothetical protein
VVPVPTSAQLTAPEVTRIAGIVAPAAVVAAGGVPLPDGDFRVIPDSDLRAWESLPPAGWHLGDAGRMAVAENAGQFRRVDKLLHEFRRKARSRVGKMAEAPGQRRAGHLPMARRRVLAEGYFLRAAVNGVRRDIARKARRQSAGRCFARAAEAERVEIGNVQQALAQAIAVGRAARAGLRDMAERIGAFVAEIGGVGRAAAAQRIQNEQDGAGHYLAAA